MLSIPVLIYSILNEPLAPEDFKFAMDDPQMTGEAPESPTPLALKPTVRDQAGSTLPFPPFNGEAA